MSKDSDDRKLVRQGDVLLIPVAKVPTGAKKKEGRDANVVAYGEATGHHHVILDGTVYVGEEGKMFVVVGERGEIRHQDPSGVKADHDWLQIPAGEYEVRIEEEYTPEGLERVAD